MKKARDALITEAPAVRLLLTCTMLAFVGLFVVLPVALMFAQALSKGYAAYTNAIMEENARAAIRLTLLVAAIAVPCNMVFGLAASWAITKFDFLGRRLLITLIEIPFSVSPVISGLIYVLLFGADSALSGWLDRNNIQILFAVPALVIATVFV